MVLVVVALAGFAASLVDNSLGMGFGATLSTVLLAGGLAPAAVSATVNIAKVVVGAASGTAHWRFGNVDRRLVVLLALPGCVGAVVGVTVLANLDGDSLRPYLAMLLLAVGMRMLWRFRHHPTAAAVDPGAAAGDGDPGADVAPTEGSYSRRGLGPLAFVGGMTNGFIGMWGPVVTPALLHRKGLEPRMAIGSVSAAEMAVALVSSVSLLGTIGGSGVKASHLVALLVGGTVAAPIAAWSVKRIAPRLLGLGAGALLVGTNARELVGWADLGAARWAVYGVMVAIAMAGFTAHRWSGRRAPEPATTD